jgi:molybdenum cofactor synthesis domain-containing protein
MGDKITFAVLTLSDKGALGQREDLSGPAIAELIKDIGVVKVYEILPDERELIKTKLVELTNTVDVIFTTGGTGLSPRDVTPEATLEVLDRQIPGISEAMRQAGLAKTKRAMLSRAVAGQRGNTLIINLPGSLKAVKENLEVIRDVIPHAVEKIKGDTADCGR